MTPRMSLVFKGSASLQSVSQERQNVTTGEAREFARLSVVCLPHTRMLRASSCSLRRTLFFLQVFLLKELRLPELANCCCWARLSAAMFVMSFETYTNSTF